MLLSNDDSPQWIHCGFVMTMKFLPRKIESAKVNVCCRRCQLVSTDAINVIIEFKCLFQLNVFGISKAKIIKNQFVYRRHTMNEDHFSISHHRHTSTTGPADVCCCSFNCCSLESNQNDQQINLSNPNPSSNYLQECVRRIIKSNQAQSREEEKKTAKSNCI